MRKRKKEREGERSWDRNFTVTKFPQIDVDIGAVALHTHDLQVAAKRSRMDAAERQP